MNSHIDFRTLPDNVPSLCIPRVFSNWTESRIRRIFDDLAMGEIQRIDVISKTTEKGEKFNRVFVHFKRWFSNQNSDMARERLLNGKEIKIVYDDPWFWKVSAYREAKKSDHKEERPRATIKFDDDREQPVAKGRPSDRPSTGDRRPSTSTSDRRPIAPSLTKSYRSHDDHRPRDEPRDRRDRPNDSNRKNTKEVVDKHLDEVNKAIGNIGAISSPPPPVESLVQGNGAVVYDMAAISSAKRRKILIKKHTTVQKPPLKIEEEEPEEGELTESDWLEDGLQNCGF